MKKKRGSGALPFGPNSVVEKLDDDSEQLAEALHNHFQTLRKETKALIERCQRTGHVDAALSSEDAAEFYVGCVMSASLLNRASRNETAGAAFVRQASEAIAAWRNTHNYKL